LLGHASDIGYGTEDVDLTTDLYNEPGRERHRASLFVRSLCGCR
jgi:hypothetical protein